MAAKKKKTQKTPRRRRRVGAGRSGGFMKELEMAAGAAGGAVAANIIAHKLPVATSPNGEKVKSAAIALVGVLLASKSKSPMMKMVGTGIATGGAMQLVKQFNPTLLSGDDEMLGYTMPLGSEEARIYAGLGYIENLGEEDYMSGDTGSLGDDLLGDGDLFGDDEMLGDDLLGDAISTQGVSF
jgi:hypothetical protein